MDCPMCEGTTTKVLRPKAFERDGRLVVVRDVPMEICDRCGEVYLDTAVAKRLDVLARRMFEVPADQAVGHFTPAA